jgi:hypothetical protein
MGLNIKCHITAGFLERWTTVKRMKEILSALPDDAELLPNRVGNLNVYTPPPESKWLGFIDINTEEYCPAKTI